MARRGVRRYPVTTYRQLIRLMFESLIDDIAVVSFHPEKSRTGHAAVSFSNAVIRVNWVSEVAGGIVLGGHLKSCKELLQEVRIPTDKVSFVFPDKGEISFYTNEWGYCTLRVRSFSSEKERLKVISESKKG